ncbi:MAG: sel1 repeat family protein [Pseudomonadota bacterium]|nr:sel1 repeat family protein [Pseudomonadota bacterium]
MRIVSVAQGRGQFAGFVRSRAARKPRRWRLWAMPGMLVCVAIFSNPAAADGLRNGLRAFAAHDYVTAARIFTDLAPLGDARAQTYLGYMFANGKGVPQNFMVAAGWYRCASQQGFPAAQYMLGLMYDKGQGVPQDYVIAYALLNLAVAGAGPEREHWVRIRDAVASKLSLIERVRAQQLAFEGLLGGGCLPIVTGY